MGKKDPRVDAYIEKAQPFAKPILKHVRQLVHSAVPEVEETMKWSTPFFDYKGAMIGMAAFKQHMHIVFWKFKLMNDPEGLLGDDVVNSGFGRITSMDELPSKKIFLEYIHEAARLNDQGIKLTARKKKSSAPKPEALVPDFLTVALKRNKKAREAFEGFSPSHRKEYIEWLTGAKSEETRNRRLATALEWLAEGKSRNWKYERKK